MSPPASRRPRTLRRSVVGGVLAAACGLLAAGATLATTQRSHAVTLGAAAPNSPAADPFADLPLIAAGQLEGRIVYVSGCELRSFDLASASDGSLGPLTLCDSYLVLSPEGSSVAERAPDGSIIIERPGGGQRILARAEPRGRVRGNFIEPPSYSGDGSKVLYCSYRRGSLATVVADVRTGKTVATVRGTCETVFTARGLASVVGQRVVLAGRTIFRLHRAIPANTVVGIPPQGNPLAANLRGTLLAFAARPLRGGRLSNIVVIHVLRLDGRELARYAAPVDITMSFQALALDARSAVVWWGDILQLAAFGTPTRSFTLRYQVGPHAGDGERMIFPASYSPVGNYAVMPRQQFALVGSPPREPQPALVLSASSLKPLFRVPIDARAAEWVR